MDNAQIKDGSIIENLKYMLDMGYTNFTVNYQLLIRNNNDLTVALNLLCNNMVSDSVFDKWWTQQFDNSDLYKRLMR